MNARLAALANIRSSDLVLDAGCGFGGSAVWLAQKYGCRVIGITICTSHIPIAQQFARERHVDHLIEFYERDFTETGFDSASFNVVWALESACYAENKRAFIAESHRILKKSGRFIVADGFLHKHSLSSQEQKMYDRWRRGWVVPDLAHIEQFSANLEEFAFEHIEFHDITRHVARTSADMPGMATVMYCISNMLQHPPVQQNHWKAAIAQNFLFTNQVCRYGIYSAQKAA